jgi:hypothetical protein
MVRPAGFVPNAARAVAFGVYADLAYNAFSATNSSPQTTELFAADRETTLWKYVRMGDVQVVALGAFGAFLDRSPWPLIGVGSVAVVMHLMYRHALTAGKGQPPPGGTS